jgi:hypothetical protein
LGNPASFITAFAVARRVVRGTAKVRPDFGLYQIS